ncbi:MAG TPA: carboxymuconolactone decarboxylase family protein [Gemmatimonadales bacterium]|nr:carboxymuconolactone decarboxylase family protein [Gemmatimonadales bacterium]
MPRIYPIDPATATGDAATHLATTRKMFGRAPNVFATAANSPSTVGALVGLWAGVGSGTLGAKLGEQLAIVVAQSNGCEYCLSAHTALGKMHGLDDAELAAAKQAGSRDPKTAAMLKLALEINQSRGQVSDMVLGQARKAGITDSEIIEIIGHVALNVFTNYLNNVSETEIDFPVVPLDAAA